MTDNEFEDVISGSLETLYRRQKAQMHLCHDDCGERALDGIYLFAVLHIPTDFKTPGAWDLCVDSEDRVYAVTELEIQCIRSFGLVDVILLNSETAVVDQISWSGWRSLCPCV